MSHDLMHNSTIFFSVIQSYRVDLLSNEGKTTDKWEQNDWTTENNLFRYVNKSCILFENWSNFFQVTHSYCSHLSVGLLSYDSRSTLIRLDCRKNMTGNTVNDTLKGLFWQVCASFPSRPFRHFISQFPGQDPGECPAPTAAVSAAAHAAGSLPLLRCWIRRQRQLWPVSWYWPRCCGWCSWPPSPARPSGQRPGSGRVDRTPKSGPAAEDEPILR